MVVMAIFAIGFASSESEEERLESDKKNLELFGGEGTYEVVDAEGNKWYYTINADHKITIKKEGMSDDDMYYGSWIWALDFDEMFSSNTQESDTRAIEFGIDSYQGNPNLYWPDGSLEGDVATFSSDGWLYRELESYKSKNPTRRLRMKKLN